MYEIADLCHLLAEIVLIFVITRLMILIFEVRSAMDRFIQRLDAFERRQGNLKTPPSEGRTKGENP